MAAVKSTAPAAGVDDRAIDGPNKCRAFADAGVKSIRTSWPVPDCIPTAHRLDADGQGRNTRRNDSPPQCGQTQIQIHFTLLRAPTQFTRFSFFSSMHLSQKNFLQSLHFNSSFLNFPDIGPSGALCSILHLGHW